MSWSYFLQELKHNLLHLAKIGSTLLVTAVILTAFVLGGAMLKLLSGLLAVITYVVVATLDDCGFYE